MQKVCYLLPQYYQNSAENFYHIINFLSELGKQCELYVIIENSDKDPKIDNVKKIYVINEERKHKYHIRFQKIVSIYFELYKKGVKLFFSRASSTGVFPLVVANRFLNLNRANVIFWSCGQDVVALSFKPTKKNIKRLMTRLLSKFIFKAINYLATGPELMVNYYNLHFDIPKEKIVLLYNDISMKRFHPLENRLQEKQRLIGNKKKMMLFVHTFNYSRGTDLLHKIAIKLKEKNSDTVILAIGREGDYSQSLDAEIKKYELEEYLMNLGQIANKDIMQYYQIAELFIMPSRGEGFPRVIIEAMSCKSVPLSFDVGGVKNILHHSLLDETLINVTDEEKFIDRSIELIDSDILDTYSDLCYEKVQEYSTEKIVNMYLQAFQRIAK